jgi:hypothetical protein
MLLLERVMVLKISLVPFKLFSTHVKLVVNHLAKGPLELVKQRQRYPARRSDVLIRVEHIVVKLSQQNNRAEDKSVKVVS